MPAPAHHQPLTPAKAPALTSPAIAVACPACGSQPGALCTSHNGTRLRRHNVHQARTAALTAAD
ncbi:zinc finger domain-containing protein [Streptomyces mangrovi]|uniref:zinc finger domain-containing protein n=1 Tax=Streptomyces mangrovi TaxID=1206892 RepID=UPI00399CB5EA